MESSKGTSFNRIDPIERENNNLCEISDDRFTLTVFVLRGVQYRFLLYAASQNAVNRALYCLILEHFTSVYH